MAVASKIILPYEPEYVGHRQADERHKQIREWLRKRERELAGRSPPLVAKQPAKQKKK
jgi:hypothetical protein